MIYALAAVGAISITWHVYRLASCIRSDLKSKSSPWLGGPRGPGPLNGH